MWAYILIAAVVPTMILGYPIFQCPGDLPTPREIRIEGCDTSPCHFSQGTVVAFQLDATTNELSPTLELVVHFTALGETVEFPIPPFLSNVCNFIDINCPVQAGQDFTYTSAIPLITDLHGGIPAQFRARIYNASGSTLLCTLVHLVIH